jgi:hypothetical protein
MEMIHKRNHLNQNLLLSKQQQEQLLVLAHQLSPRRSIPLRHVFR